MEGHLFEVSLGKIGNPKYSLMHPLVCVCVRMIFRKHLE